LSPCQRETLTLHRGGTPPGKGKKATGVSRRKKRKEEKKKEKIASGKCGKGGHPGIERWEGRERFWGKKKKKKKGEEHHNSVKKGGKGAIWSKDREKKRKIMKVTVVHREGGREEGGRENFAHAVKEKKKGRLSRFRNQKGGGRALESFWPEGERKKGEGKKPWRVKIFEEGL